MTLSPDYGAAEATLARMFWSRVDRSGGAPAQIARRGAGWRVFTWAEVGDAVRELAIGLLALGVRPGERVAILSRSSAEWVQADFAILSVGAITVPIYPTHTPEQVAYVVNDSGSLILVAEDPSQLAKALEVRNRMPGLSRIVVTRGYEGQDPSVVTWERLRRLGRDRAPDLAPVLAERIAAIAPAETATIVYTSGTTGPAKGVVQSHANHMAALASVARVAPVETGDVHLLFLPLAHSFARLEAFMGVYLGLTTAFAESFERLAEDIRDVRPHFLVAVPRVFEKLHARILADVASSSRARQRVFAWAMNVGREVSRRRMARQRIPRLLALGHRLAHRLVFARIRASLGGRVRFAVSGGAPLSAEIGDFFHAAGLLILEGYGLTESCPVLAFNRIDAFRFGSVGRAVPGVDLRLAADGEILARGPNIASGYWRRPEDSAEVFGADGWLRTGDVGRLDRDGFLHIVDRKKDLIVTSGGINIAPQIIETLLQSDPLISQALVYGDRRPYPVALVTVNPSAAAELTSRHGVPWTEPSRLGDQPLVRERLERIVEDANARLPSYARIKKFAVLPAELTEEAGEVTPTQKLRRRCVADEYADILESLYAQRPEPARAGG